MFAVAKKIRPVEATSPRQIPARGKIEANTPEWRERVTKELEGRGRGAAADLVRHLKERHPKFSSGYLAEMLGPDEKPGQARFSRYIPEINRYLWPSEFQAEIEPALVTILRTMNSGEQLSLAEFLRLSREKK